MPAVLKSIKSSGGDYATVALWEAAIPADQAVGDPWVGEIQEAYNAQAAGLAVNVSNANSAPHRLTVAEAYRFYNAPSWPDMQAAFFEAARMDVESGTPNPHINVGTPTFTIEWVGVRSYRRGVFVAAAGAVVRHSLFCGTAAPFNGGIYAASGGVVVVHHCTFWNHNNDYSLAAPAGTLTAYHCTVVALSGVPGFLQSSTGTLNCYGCIGMRTGGATAIFSGTIGGDENVSEDTSAPGTTTWHSQSGVLASTAPATADLHLHPDKAGSYPVTDRTGTVPELATDIDGEPRSAFDAGADEFVVAGGRSILIGGKLVGSGLLTRGLVR